MHTNNTSLYKIHLNPIQYLHHNISQHVIKSQSNQLFSGIFTLLTRQVQPVWSVPLIGQSFQRKKPTPRRLQKSHQLQQPQDTNHLRTQLDAVRRCASDGSIRKRTQKPKKTSSTKVLEFFFRVHFLTSMGPHVSGDARVWCGMIEFLLDPGACHLSKTLVLQKQKQWAQLITCWGFLAIIDRLTKYMPSICPNQFTFAFCTATLPWRF